MRRPPLAVAAAAATALLAGCGSSSSTATPSGIAGLGPATVPRADYVARANAICAAANMQIAALGAPPGPPTAVTADLLMAWAVHLAGVDSALASEAPDLAALPAPDQGQDEAGAVLSGLAAVIKDGATAEAAARAGDLAGFRMALSTYTTDTASATSRASAFGLTDCAR